MGKWQAGSPDGAIRPTVPDPMVFLRQLWSQSPIPTWSQSTDRTQAHPMLSTKHWFDSPPSVTTCIDRLPLSSTASIRC